MKTKITRIQLAQLLFLNIERSVWEVAERFVVEKCSAIASMNRLREKGWVTSRRSIVISIDGRPANGKLYSLTQAGREAMREHGFFNADRATRENAGPAGIA